MLVIIRRWEPSTLLLGFSVFNIYSLFKMFISTMKESCLKMWKNILSEGNVAENAESTGKRRVKGVSKDSAKMKVVR